MTVRYALHPFIRIPSARLLAFHIHHHPPRSPTANKKFPSRRTYTVALTRGVPRSFPNALSSSSSDSDTTTTTSSTTSPISYEVAKSQNESYVQTLRSILPTYTLPPSEDHPDCVFIEDAAITIGQTAVVTRIGAQSRTGEVDAVKETLTNFGLDVIDMRDFDGATCDGGDVLHPTTYPVTNHRSLLGRHLFVGLSNRTNEAGMNVLQRTFEKMGVEVIPVPDITNTGMLHLKSILTHLDGTTLLAPCGPMGDEILCSMKAKERDYDIVRVPDSKVCNVVSVNGIILAPNTDCEETKSILEREIVERRKMELRFLDASEFGKCDGSLTCMSLLLDV